MNSPEQITDSVLTPEKEIVTTVGPAPLSSPPVENFSSVKTKKTNKKALIIFLIFLGVMIGIGAFWLGRFTKETGIGTIPSPTAVPTISQPTPTLDQTTGWKTYIDTKFGYSIKYPSEWLFNTETRSFREGDIFSVSIVGKDQKKDTEFYDGASLTIGEPIKTEKDIRTWVKEYYPVNNLDDEPNIFSEETIASLSFQKFFTCGLGCFTYYNIKHNGYVYRIVIFADGPDKIKYEQILSQILSTFKFLSSDETANWKTYTNSVEKFSFKYPQSWFLKESSSMIQIFNYDVDKAPGRSYDPVRDGNLFKVEVFLDNKFSNLTEWFENEKNTPDQSNDLPKEFLNIKNIFVSSQEGLFFELKSSMTDSLVGVATFKLPQGSLVHFWGGLNYEGNKNYFDQILSTFKFLDQASDPTANWSVFTSKKGYSIRIPPNMKVVEAGFGSGRPEESAGIGIIETSAKEPLLSPHMAISVFTDSKTTLKQLAQENYDKNVNHPSNSIISVTESFREEKFENNDSYQYSFKAKGLVTPDAEYSTQEGEYRFIWTQSGSKIYCLMVADTPTFNQILSTFKFN